MIPIDDVYQGIMGISNMVPSSSDKCCVFGYEIMHFVPESFGGVSSGRMIICKNFGISKDHAILLEI